MSDDFETPKKYLRIQTGVAVTVADVKKDTEKEQIVLVLQSDDGSLIDAQFSLTGDYADYAKKQMTKIKEILGIEKITEAKGKQIGIQINRKDFTYKKGPKAGNKGQSYNPSGYFPVAYLNPIFAETQTDKTDDINF